MSIHGNKEASRILILNCGCGSNKIKGAINIDIEHSLEPDIVCDFKKPLPFSDETFDTIFFFHAIEHIEEKYHPIILLGLRSVLKTGHPIYISYPEFTKCAQNFISNYRGQRDFWKHTIYGRQSHPNDFHVSLMYTPNLVRLLGQLGFENIHSTEEPGETYNSVVKAIKAEHLPNSLEQIYKRDWLY